MAQPKELNFNEIEKEKLIDFELDMLDYDGYEDSEDLDITNFCLELEANEVIDDEQFDYMEI